MGDLTGKFPDKLNTASGNSYILVMVSTKTNYIHIEPLRDRQGQTITAAYERGIIFFESRGIKTKYERLDNETSIAFTRMCTRRNITIEYVPPGQHRANISERAIQTVKNIILSALATTNPFSPLEEWDKLLPHIEILINIMRPSNLNTLISAYESLFGKFIFKNTPLAPPGCAVMILDRAEDRKTWEFHSTKGFYIGPATHHHRCYRIFVPKTKSMRISDSIYWLPSPISPPIPSDAEMITMAVEELKETAKSLHKSKTPILGWRELLTKRADDIDEYISLHHPKVHEKTESYTHNYIKQYRDAIENIQNIEFLEPNPEPSPTFPEATSDPNQLPNSSISPPATELDPEEIINDEENPPLDYNQILPTGDPISPILDIPIIHHPNSIEIQREAEQTINPQNSHFRPSRERSKPKHFDGYYLYNMMETLLMANLIESETDGIGLDQSGIPLTFKTAMSGPHSDTWTTHLSEEYDRLFDTGTISWDGFTTKPVNKKATYFSIQVKEKRKSDGTIKRRVRGTVGGDKIEFTGERSSSTASMECLKCFLNAVVSEDAHWCTADIQDYYLGTPMENPEYMYILEKDIPPATKMKYDIEFRNGRTMVTIRKGMYGLPHAGRIAQDKLILHLIEDGYHQCPHTPCLFIHESRNIFFVLVVDDFGIKYKREEDRDHLFATLRKHYSITTDLEGTKYLGINIHHDRTARTITLSMPNYVQDALTRFGIIKNTENTNSPLVYHPVVYGLQYEHTDDSPPITDPDKIKFIRQVVGVFLYYSRAVDETMLCSLNKIASRQAKPTEDLMKDGYRFLQYAASFPNGQLIFKASKMKLFIHSDASYLSESDSRSRVGGFPYLGDIESDHNGSLGSISQIMPNVLSSVAEAEYAALFTNSLSGCILQNILFDLGYPQIGTLISCDNTTASDAANRTIRMRKLQTTAMRHHWIQDRVKSGQFKVKWAKGSDNKADFFTKILPVHEFKSKRHLYTSDLPVSIRNLQLSKLQITKNL